IVERSSHPRHDGTPRILWRIKVRLTDERIHVREMPCAKRPDWRQHFSIANSEQLAGLVPELEELEVFVESLIVCVTTLYHRDSSELEIARQRVCDPSMHHALGRGTTRVFRQQHGAVIG